jgi:hypothetical protein
MKFAVSKGLFWMLIGPAAWTAVVLLLSTSTADGANENVTGYAACASGSELWRGNLPAQASSPIDGAFYALASAKGENQTAQ